MSFVGDVVKATRDFFSPSKRDLTVTVEKSDKVEKSNTQTNTDFGLGWLNNFNFDSFGGFDRFTDELLNTINDCGKLLKNQNPRNFVNYSNLIFRIFPLYKKAIRLRTIFIGRLSIKNLTALQSNKIDNEILFIEKKIPIYDSNTLYAKAYGINALLNMISEDCDIYGMSYVQLIYDKGGKVTAIQIYKPTDFCFNYDKNNVKQLYYGDTVVNISSIYIFCYQSVRGYDWGAPLIYGNKFITDNVIKLINAQMQGLMRNMNPFDVTVMSTDLKQLAEFPGQQDEIFQAMTKLKADIIASSQKSLQGESVHLIANIPALTSFNTAKAASTITFMDAKTFSTLIEIFCAGLDVPYQLLMNVSGSMNSDQSSNGILLMEACASDFMRPQLLPVFDRLIKNIFFSHNMPVTDSDIEVSFLRNETMLQSLNALPKYPQYPIPEA